MRPRVDVIASPVWTNVRRSKLTPYSILLASLALTACDDLSLHVEVTHPPAAAVASTTVSIYESNATACRQLEFGDLSAAELQAILVAEQTIGANPGGSLDGISRTGKKLVAARGFDAMGRFLTAGCTEHAEITGEDVVAVATDFAATLSIGGRSNSDLAIPITLTDAEGRSLDGHPVAWRVYGPAGAAPALTDAGVVASADDSWELAAPTCTGAAGSAQLHPVPPSRVSGYAIEIRPSWSAQPNALITSLTAIDPTLALMIPKPDVRHPCAIRVAGSTRRLVCLQQSGVAPTSSTIAREYAVSVVNGNARLQQAGEVTIDAATIPIAVFSVPRGTDRDVYALTTRGAVLGLFNPSVPPVAGNHLGTTDTASDAVLVPACDNDQAPQLVMQVTTALAPRLVAMPPTGGATSNYHGIAAVTNRQLRLRGTGCVTELRPDLEAARRPGLVVDISRGDTTEEVDAVAAFECDHPDPAQCRVTLPVAGGGATLSAPASIDEPRLTGMFVDATGVVMSSWVLLAGPSKKPQLVERARVPAAAIPNFVATGHFDADSQSDLFWDLPNPTQTTTSFQVTYGRTIDAQRLSAVSATTPLVVEDLVIGELTGDSADDVAMVARQQRLDGGTPLVRGIVVIPMNAPAPPSRPPVDPACGGG